MVTVGAAAPLIPALHHFAQSQRSLSSQALPLLFLVFPCLCHPSSLLLVPGDS